MLLVFCLFVYASTLPSGSEGMIYILPSHLVYFSPGFKHTRLQVELNALHHALVHQRQLVGAVRSQLVSLRLELALLLGT